jgi:hypothetical protein
MQRIRNILLSLTFSFSSSLMAQDEDIVVTTTTDSKIFRVSIESTDSADLGLLNNAFTAHGAYKVVQISQSFICSSSGNRKTPLSVLSFWGDQHEN